MKIFIQIIILSFLCYNTVAQTSKDSLINPTPTLTLLWETDTVLKDLESAIYNSKNKVIYVTCIDGHWLDPNGKGFISKVDVSGKIIEHKWIENLDAPTGTALYEGKLFVADFDKIVEIDINKSKIIESHTVDSVERINDLTVTENGTIYGTGTMKGKLFSLNKGNVSPIQGGFAWPNGVLYENDKLLMTNDNTVGYFNFEDKKYEIIAEDIKYPDGITAIGNGAYLVSGWEGLIYHISNTGKKTLLLDSTSEGVNAADICFIPELQILLVPAMLKHKLMAYKLTYEN